MKIKKFVNLLKKEIKSVAEMVLDNLDYANEDAEDKKVESNIKLRIGRTSLHEINTILNLFLSCLNKSYKNNIEKEAYWEMWRIESQLSMCLYNDTNERLEELIKKCQ